MKISAFHLCPYRDLADDFEKKHKSAWFTLPFHDVADPRKMAQYYNWTLDELLFAAKSGFDGVCTNEHHQNAYGFMVNANMMGSVLARSTRELNLNTAIVQMGETAVFVTVGAAARTAVPERGERFNSPAIIVPPSPQPRAAR